MNPEDMSPWKDLGNRRVQTMKHGKYNIEGWKEIDVLENNPGGLNQMRVIFRAVPGDLEVKLLQVHGRNG